MNANSIRVIITWRYTYFFLCLSSQYTRATHSNDLQNNWITSLKVWIPGSYLRIMHDSAGLRWGPGVCILTNPAGELLPTERGARAEDPGLCSSAERCLPSAFQCLLQHFADYLASQKHQCTFAE